MLIDDFSLETVEVGGYPIQTFKNRFRNVWEMFLQSTVTYQDEIYLIEGPTRITFGQAADLAIRLAARIKDMDGVGQGDRIGILMENSIGFILSFWAIQNLGATAVIFNTRLAVPELKRQLQFSDLKILLSSPIMSSKVREIPNEELIFQHIVFDDVLLKNLPKGDQSPSLTGISEDDTTFILFTSGTSGTPKGVMLTHRNIITCAFRSGVTIAHGLALAASSGATVQAPSQKPLTSLTFKILPYHFININRFQKLQKVPLSIRKGTRSTE